MARLPRSVLAPVHAIRRLHPPRAHLLSLSFSLSLLLSLVLPRLAPAIFTRRQIKLEAIPATDMMKGRRQSVAETLSLDKFIDRDTLPDAMDLAWTAEDAVFVVTALGRVYKIDTEKQYSQVAIETTVNGPSVGCEVIGSHYVVFCQDGRILYYDLENALAKSGENKLAHNVMASCKCGTVALMAATAGRVSVVSAAGPGVMPIIELENYHSADIIGVGLSQDTHAVTFDTDGHGKMWDCNFAAMQNIAPLATTKIVGVPTCMSVCPSGPGVAVGTASGQINVFELSTGKFRLVWSERVHTGAVTHIDYSRTGEYIFSVGAGIMVVSRGMNNCQVLGYLDTPSAVLSLASSFPENAVGGVRMAMSSKTNSGSKITTALFPPLDQMIKSTPLPKDRVKYSETELDYVAHSLTFARRSLFVAGKRGKIGKYTWDDDSHLVDQPTWMPGSNGHPKLAAAFAGNLIASHDDLGILMLRSTEEGAGKPVAVVGHKSGDGSKASSGVALTRTGTGAVSVGHSGELVVWKIDGAPAFPDEARARMKFSLDLGQEDEVEEDTETEGRTAIDHLASALEVTQSGTDESEADSVKKDMLNKISAIRTQLMKMIGDNGLKPDLEQLERDEFQLDVVEKARMTKEGDTKIATLKDDIQMQILAQQFLRFQIKKDCWDAMEVKGKTLYAFQAKIQLANFPLRRRTAEELDELKKVRMAREIERQMEKAKRKEAKAGATEGDEGDDDDDDDDDLERDLYDPLTLYCAQRKRAQIVMLTDALYQLQTEFNKEFENICADKIAVKGQIKSKNEQISKVVAELKLGGAESLIVELFEPKEHVLEHPEKLLEVDPADIKVPKVLNAQEKIEKAEQDRLDAEKAARDAMDNPRERGVQEMLDGRLEGKGEEVVWEKFPAPEFLSSLPEEQWTEQMLKDKQVYDTLVEEREELRDKRRKLLNSDLAALKSAVETATTGFDDRLQELFHKKIRLQQLVIREELIILKLVKTLRDEAATIEQEGQLHQQLLALKTTRIAAQTSMAQAQAIVSEYEEEYAVVRKEDTALDKTFKVRLQREFPAQQFEEYLDGLHKLFKKRPRRSKHTTMLDSAELELDEEVDYPEGLDRAVWDKMLEFRNEKIESEKHKRGKEEELAERRSYFTRRKNEKETVDLETAMLVEQISDTRSKRLADTLDLEVMVNIKQGQVEVIHKNDFEPDYDTAVLIDRSKVEELNAEVRRLAEIKVQHMKERMQFRKGIHILEWEHAKLDMLAQDLVNKTKDIQMLRVTRHMTLEGGDNGNREDKSRKDNETLERTIRQQQVIMEQMLAERKRQVKMIKGKMKKLASEGTSLEPKIETLVTEVAERRMMCDVQLQATGGVEKINVRLFESNKKESCVTEWVGACFVCFEKVFYESIKVLNSAQQSYPPLTFALYARVFPPLQRGLREAAQRRRYVDTVKAQAEEISFLRDELERRRMKTFPAFVPGQRVAF